MCLALPAQVVELNESDRSGAVTLQGNRYQVSFVLVPDVGVGDWVLVHAGYAIQSVAPDEARETWELVDEIMKHGQAEGCS